MYQIARKLESAIRLNQPVTLDVGEAIMVLNAIDPPNDIVGKYERAANAVRNFSKAWMRIHERRSR